MEKYIERDLKNNPQFFREPHSGKFVDLSVVMHVVCNVNRPDGVPVGAFVSSMEAVAAEVDMIPPMENVAPVVHGHWEVEKEDWGFCEAIGRNHVHRKFRCSVCGYETGDQAEKFVCCPICTARMDGGNHEAD